MVENENPFPLVVTTFGRRVELRLGSGERVIARIKGRKLKVVCGDRVAAAPIEGEKEYLVTDIQPRENVLSRPDSRGRVEILAANVSMIAAVAAPFPRPDWFVIDRYLAAAELAAAAGIVVWNKTDIEASPESARELQAYEASGYRIYPTSTLTGAGLDELAADLAGHTAIFAGQSGVGKTSLINHLLGSKHLRTAAVSDKSGEGRHTTVNSALLSLPSGGSVIDSPGVRDFAPAIERPGQTVSGFPEIEAAGAGCRYANCRHLREPGCAVKAAMESGKITPRRYESYRRLLRLTETFSDRHR